MLKVTLENRNAMEFPVEFERVTGKIIKIPNPGAIDIAQLQNKFMDIFQHKTSPVFLDDEILSQYTIIDIRFNGRQITELPMQFEGAIK